MINGRGILILGGGGFLGANLCRELVSQGANVYIYSRSRYFDEPYLGANFIFGSLSNVQKITSLLPLIDVVFNLVGTSSPSTSETNRIEDIQANVIGLINLLDQCRSNGINKVIYTSSGGTVYGNTSGQKPCLESDPTLPISTYGINKLAGEHFLRLYNHHYGMKNLSLRISNPFGPYQQVMKGQGVINIFMRKILEGEEIMIVGDGHQVRDYVYVDDVVSAMIKSISYDGDESTLNIGSGNGFQLVDVVRNIESEVGKNAIIKFMPSNLIGVNSIVLDVSLAKQELSWKPECEFKSSLTVLHKYIKDIIQ